MFAICKLTGRHYSIMPKIRQKRLARTVTISRLSSRKSTTVCVKNIGLAHEILAAIVLEYEKHSCTARGADMKRYMRGKFEFYGLASVERRAIDKKVFSRFAKPDRTALMELLLLLWQRPQRELQYFAIDVVKSKADVLCGTSAAECLESAKFVGVELISSKSWWDTVDAVASNVIGHLVYRYPDKLVPLMDEWIVSDDLWLRRTAILHQLRRNANTDKDRLFRYCLQCCDEREFFIEKAIGWALRQYFRYNPAVVKRFVAENKHKLAKLSVKEALKHA